jgi:hypothetical protein
MKPHTRRYTKINGKLILPSLGALFILLLVAALFAPLGIVQASNPSSGTLNPTTGASVTFNGTAPGGSSPEGETTCVEGVNCDTFALTLAGAPSDWTGKLVRVKLDWALPSTDYDLYVHKGTVTGPEVARSANGPTITESADFDPSVNGTGDYVVHVVYFAAVTAADQYKGSATVIDAAPAGPAPTPPPVSTATPPTYDNFAPPSTLGQRAGEPSIGLNWSTGRAMFIASLQTLRVTFDDSVSPATATWENKSAPNTSITSFDPMLFTDSQTNRTFVSQLLPSKLSLMSFTDNDGESWTPSQGSGINSGVDHQTIGGGPYAKNADGSLKGGAIQRPGLDGRIYPNAVYYASQDIGLAEIARSDDGGLTFGVAVPMYDLTQCGGLHGHIKVARDGTVYVPNKNCSENQAVVVSEDNGLTWQVRAIPGSKKGVSDPSLGIATDGTVYFGYANADGKARIAVSHDRGKTWENDQNVGFYQNINNSVFPAVTAGDPDRAAFFFLGTTTPGTAGTGTDQSQPYFDGTWYGYISTTYDGGKTWVTVNATPNDPVQRGVICTNGTTCPTGTRNLLDFNDLEVDKKGRAVAALADGCITASCVQGVDKDGDGRLTRFDNDGARRALILRQSSGLGLFKAYDPQPVITTTTIEDDDTRIAYSNGWHLMNDANASAGHFRLNNGRNSTYFARLTFDVTGQSGSITYNYAKSPKGGSAELFLDGVSKGVIQYSGPKTSGKSPEFGYTTPEFSGLSTGSHTLELRNIKGAVYVDGFTLKNATSNAKPFSGPGTTTSYTGTVNVGSDLLSSIIVPDGTQQIAVMAESTGGLPIRLLLIDPAGSIVGTADATNGTAVVESPVTQSGTYLIKVVNLGVGPVEVFTAATPLVAR